MRRIYLVNYTHNKFGSLGSISIKFALLTFILIAIKVQLFATDSIDTQYADASYTEKIVIDAAIFYTSDIINRVGSEVELQNSIKRAVGDVNTCFKNSLIDNVVIRLVYLGYLDENMSGNFADDMDRLVTKEDGYYDTIPKIQDEYGADLLSVIVEKGDANGISNPTTGYTIVEYDAMVSEFTLAHEWGHCFGCGHERGRVKNPMSEFGYGYIFLGNDGKGYGTIMSIGSRNRIPYFSNPNVMYKSVAIGVPIGEENSANNARQIVVQAQMIANRKTSSIPVSVCRHPIQKAKQFREGFPLKTIVYSNDRHSLIAERSNGIVWDVQGRRLLLQSKKGRLPNGLWVYKKSW